MDVVQTFGNIVGRQAAENPQWARKLLLTGWRAQLLRLKVAPDRRLPPSRQYASVVAMDKITRAMMHPENAAAFSIFSPYEPLEAAGVLPYSVEQMSSFIAGTKCENAFLQLSENDGFCETMCSYHRVFLGALAGGMVPPPAFAVYTNLACDGNMITFPHIQAKLGIPGFCIDVPFERSEDAVADVARQIRELVAFVEDQMHVKITEERLCESVVRSHRSARSYRGFLEASPGRRLPSDMTCEMYAFLMNHVIMGSPETLRFCQMLEAEMRQAPASDGLRLVWLHTMPFSQLAAIERMNFNDRAFITACDLSADTMLIDTDPAKPYDAMARRMVYSCFNGATQARIDRAMQLAEMTQAHGAVLYCHWGCKATLGISHLMKDALEERGLPCLLLDGDGIDDANRSDGQTATRLDAFLEMLEARRK
ncbi:MAG: 2-hydroxyacyl-CoA dehydratase [Eggerthellaceae bacterium]|nr:2-hydroxyacyl-CoA dehydratase [Eggerthellaceae bacterium]